MRVYDLGPKGFPVFAVCPEDNARGAIRCYCGWNYETEKTEAGAVECAKAWAAHAVECHDAQFADDFKP